MPEPCFVVSTCGLSFEEGIRWARDTALFHGLIMYSIAIPSTLIMWYRKEIFSRINNKLSKAKDEATE